MPPAAGCHSTHTTLQPRAAPTHLEVERVGEGVGVRRRRRLSLELDRRRLSRDRVRDRRRLHSQGEGGPKLWA
jgi:hypothetical protein